MQQRLAAEFVDVEDWPLGRGIGGEGGDEFGADTPEERSGAENFLEAPKDSGHGVGMSSGIEVSGWMR